MIELKKYDELTDKVCDTIRNLVIQIWRTTVPIS